MNVVQLEVLKIKLKEHAIKVNDLFLEVYNRNYEKLETARPTLITYRTELLRTSAKIKEVGGLINAYHKHNKLESSRNIDKSTLKAFKHEFLSELQYNNGSLEELINKTLVFFPEISRVNIDNYVRHLFFKGYFEFLKPEVIIVNPEEYVIKHPDYEFRDSYLEDENCQIVITEKALRYLENEANISLKRKI